ncbi:MAG: YtxH domain-containing protein [Dehalococcoidia bacterium]|nr:YtxH domain-containing protein [Dehalococcoidia bacterium]
MTLRFIVGFLLGVVLGVSLALALAPQPGEATRHKIWEKVRERAPRGEDSE